jgi:hypothetical protein
MPGADLDVTTTQLFSRTALGSLWARRAELDDTTQKLLTSLYNNRKKGSLHGTQDVTYKLSRSRAGQLGFGRLYGTKGSLEQLQNECRATLCAGIYHDIDIVNAQPTLLVQLVRQLLDRDMPSLEHYIDNREEVLVQLMDAENCSREDAKNAVIAVLFGGSTKNEALMPLSAEIRGVAKQLSKLPAYLELFDSLKSEKNHYGSFLAYVTQTEERRCMLAMRNWMTAQGWSVDVLAYDGIMVRSRTDASITADLLTALEAAVEGATGYKVHVIEKPMTGFDVQVIDDETEAAYQDMKAKFEETHFHFTHSNTVAQQTSKGLLHMTLEHAKGVLNTWLLPTKNKRDEPELFLTKWLKDPKRRMVSELVYKKPEDCEPHEASLFSGFAYQQMQGEDPTAVALFMDILRACCGDDEDVTDYVLRYFAHCIQQPFEVAGTAIIFSSHIHGTGKDTLVNTMRRIIGRHSQWYGDEVQFFDSHDTGKEGAILIHLEEACARANKSKASRLKSMITGEVQTMNPKGVRAYTVPNVARIVMTTNEADPVKLEDSDRRYLIVNPSSRLHAKGLSWWASIQEQLKSPAFLHTVGKMLEAINLSGWNTRMLPMTKVKEDLLEFSKPNEQLFLEALQHDKPETELYALDIYSEYKLWWYKQELDKAFMAISSQSLMKRCMPYCNKLYTKHRHPEGYRYKMLPKGTS